MDPTSLFFNKLRKLTVTLESETAKLQVSFDNRNNDGDSETTARAMRAYHELNCEVGEVKGQIQDQLVQQKVQQDEVSSFIRSCRVMQRRVTQDIHGLREHWEKYGYQAPKDTVKESEAEDEADENRVKSSVEEGGGGLEEEDEDDPSSSSPPPQLNDVLRTPQLSDFGLSEMQLKRALAGGGWCFEVPPMPEMSLPHPSLNTPAPPALPITPKRALRMDDDELQTPQMHDFGITEHTMCLNNDFTMDLLRKNGPNLLRTTQDKPAQTVDALRPSLKTTAADLESPEPPVFCTAGLKIKKTNGRCSPPTQGGDADPESPCRPSHLPTTPEVPAFQTPYVNRLVDVKKSEKQQETVDKHIDANGYDFKLSLPPHVGAAGSKGPWEYDVPETSIMGVEEDQLLEMPKLESKLGNSLQITSLKIPKKTSEVDKSTVEPSVRSLDLDGPTQEFSLGTPRIRNDFQEPSTPEMPDLSSVTLDICKLMSQAQLKKPEVVTENLNLNNRQDKYINSGVNLPAVSDSEFQTLPSYLRQMTLHNLNQAVNNINRFTQDSRGEKTALHMEELRRITNVGTKTPIYILCLTELKRLKHVGGAGKTSVYELSTKG